MVSVCKYKNSYQHFLEFVIVSLCLSLPVFGDISTEHHQNKIKVYKTEINISIWATAHLPLP